MHLKRSLMPKSWPLPRKGNRWIAVANHGRDGIPILVGLRDILGVGKTKKEIKKILNDKQVAVNGKIARDKNFPVFNMDNIKVGEKNYILKFKNKKLAFEETGEFEFKIRKVLDKKILKGKVMQLNLSHGDNILTKEKADINDSLRISKDEKIIEIIKLKEKQKAVIIGGKHLGKTGIIEKIDGKMIKIICGDEKINVDIKYIILI